MVMKTHQFNTNFFFSKTCSLPLDNCTECDADKKRYLKDN